MKPFDRKKIIAHCRQPVTVGASPKKKNFLSFDKHVNDESSKMLLNQSAKMFSNSLKAIKCYVGNKQNEFCESQFHKFNSIE